jgi:hypothetical protein
MMSLEAMEQPRVAFLYELYKRSEGDSRHGVPYEDLVDALGFEERVTQRIQRDLYQEGLVELTAVPWITNVRRLVMGSAHRQGSRQTISMTYQGVRLMEDLLSMFSSMEPPAHSVS